MVECVGVVAAAATAAVVVVRGRIRPFRAESDFGFFTSLRGVIQYSSSLCIMFRNPRVLERSVFLFPQIDCCTPARERREGFTQGWGGGGGRRLNDSNRL